MDNYERHRKTYQLLKILLSPALRRKFNLTGEDFLLDGPFLLISNHASAWDPFLLGATLKNHHFYFVASEHLFRLGIATKIIQWLVAPIPRRKASSGMDTVKACLRHLRAGHSVCLFAEGEQCWDGCSSRIFPATGKLVKTSGAALVTYRLEGSYLTLPRWAKHIRRGEIIVHPVGIYPPEQLKELSAQEVNSLIERDIHEDDLELQRGRMIPFRGKRLAEGIERALYACPDCLRIGTLSSRGDRVFCSCGFSCSYTEFGFFDPAKPFETLAEWDHWQRDLLHSRNFKHQSSMLFSDDQIELTQILSDHSEKRLAVAELRQYEDCLECGEWRFPLTEMRDMALVQTYLLLFSFHDEYYQLRTRSGANLRKYLEIWKEK